MSSRERKASGSAERHPRMDPNQMTARTQVQSLLPTRKSSMPVGRTLFPQEQRGNRPGIKNRICPKNSKSQLRTSSEKQRNIPRIMTSSFCAMEVKVKIVLKTQCEQRQKLYQDYPLQVTNLNRKLTTDANQVKKHAGKLSNTFMEQQKFIHESLTLQNRVEEFKSLCEEYLEKFEVLKEIPLLKS